MSTRKERRMYPHEREEKALAAAAEVLDSLRTAVEDDEHGPAARQRRRRVTAMVDVLKPVFDALAADPTSPYAKTWLPYVREMEQLVRRSLAQGTRYAHGTLFDDIEQL